MQLIVGFEQSVRKRLTVNSCKTRTVKVSQLFTSIYMLIPEDLHVSNRVRS